MRKIILYVLYFIIVVALGTAIIVSFHPHHSKTKTQTAKAPRTSSQSNAGSTPAEQTGQTSSTSTTTPNATSSSTSSVTSSQLANTGPGTTTALISIFVASSSFGSLAYRRYQLVRARA